ncbi:MAG TPA: hypothetical protein VLR27_09475 [Acidimicrobiales bacterium]|nr:hypothetical protein [Acidimicrobiales bacterium]
MRIRVVGVTDAAGRVVECTTPVGRLHVVWESASLPSPGDHDVELDLPTVLEWGCEVWTATDREPAHDPGRPLLSGTLLGVDEAGVAEVRVPGGLLTVETSGEPPLGAIGEAVELQPPRVLAYPFDL